MNIKSTLFTVFGLAAIMLLIGFANVGNDRRTCNKVIVSLENDLNNHFLDNNDVISLLTNGHSEVIEGQHYSKINVRTLEKRIVANSYVSRAEVFHDLKGNLIVNVDLRRPVARLVQYNGPDAYLDEEGSVLPTSEKFSSRVMLISGLSISNLNTDEEEGKNKLNSLMNLVNYIVVDEFWNAQIAQIKILENGEVILLPQVTKQYIEFGGLNNIEDKFKRLEIFYTDILPRKGWNSYKRVNVKFKEQIICE
ncbi:MAG: cell division protein FtsQ [Bacteroidota bacterium]